MPEQLRPRPPCSVPLSEADVRLDNYNWTAGLQAKTDYIWSANLTPGAFHNNLAKFLLQIPGVLEQQLNYSTTLIFDEPSFRNGVQVSGYVPRVARELVISFIAQQRRCQYSMTHHAVLGTLTAKKHGLKDAEIADKLSSLLSFEKQVQVYSRVEIEALRFADCFSTDPKSYTDERFAELRDALSEHNAKAYWNEEGWLAGIKAARVALAMALAGGASARDANAAARKAADAVPRTMPDDENERKVNAQVVELAFICLQFVALTGVLSGLNVPDEDFLPAVFQQVVPRAVQDAIESILSGSTAGMAALVPAPVDPPIKEILAGNVRVEPSAPRGTRIPLISWEVDPAQGTRDKGLALGGVQVGVYGWSFGAYFPGSLPYSLMHHGELARSEPPYSLPLLFNEDEWRNGTQTSGYNRPPVKELVIQKIYHLVRSRYGTEHHTMFFFNVILQYHGAGAFRLPGMTDQQHAQAFNAAMTSAASMIVHVTDHRGAPSDTYTEFQLALLDWVQAMVTEPHAAYRFESALRAQLEAENTREIGAGLRVLDMAGGLAQAQAMQRLVDHQISELAMMVGHMDGLGRFLTILQLESEFGVNTLAPGVGSNNTLTLQLTGAMNSRPGLFDVLRLMQIPDAVLTYNELVLNPDLNRRVRDRLATDPSARITIASAIAAKTAEF